MDEKFIELIEKSNRIAVLTGAGVSTASGISDYKSKQYKHKSGLRLEWILSNNFFESISTRNLFWSYFRDIHNLLTVKDAEPNNCHYFLSDLEKKGKDVSIITQNIDGLHQKAGSSKVYEIHGNLETVYCPSCGCKYPMDFVLTSFDIPRCLQVKDCGNICNHMLKPSIVLYDEDIKYYQQSMDAILNSDLFIVIGTALKVAPANHFPIEAYHNDDKSDDFKMVLINDTVTPLNHLFDLVIKENIKNIFI